MRFDDVAYDIQNLPKRRRLSVLEQDEQPILQDEINETPENACAICLGPIENEAYCMPCSHRQFCFSCIHAWCDLSRRCPLCNADIELLATHVRSDSDFQRHYLPELNNGRPFSEENIRQQLRDRPTHPRRLRPDFRPSRFRLDAVDEAAVAVQRRKFIYANKLFVKHVGSNPLSRYKAFTPAHFAASNDHKTRVIRFIRRELIVFPRVDHEFLVGYVISIMQSLDLRSDGAIRLLSDFLRDDAEHFVHEVHAFARSPYTELRNWDRVASYDRPPCAIIEHARPANLSPSPVQAPVSREAHKYDARHDKISRERSPGRHPRSNASNRDIGPSHHQRCDRPRSRSRSASRRRSSPRPVRHESREILREEISPSIVETNEMHDPAEARNTSPRLAPAALPIEDDVISLGEDSVIAVDADLSLAKATKPDTKAPRNIMHSLQQHLAPQPGKGIQIAGLARLQARRQAETKDVNNVKENVQKVVAAPQKPLSHEEHTAAAAAAPAIPNQSDIRKEELRMLKLKNRLEAEKIRASEKAINQAEAKVKLQSRLLAEQESAKANEAQKKTSRSALEAKLSAEREAARTSRRNLLEARLAAARSQQPDEEAENDKSEAALRKLASRGSLLGRIG